jgi:hypothetical protein
MKNHAPLTNHDALAAVGAAVRCVRSARERFVIAALVVGATGGCAAPEPLTATFTSRVVKLEACRVVGGADEGCEKDEEFAELRVDLVQVDDTTWWLYGVPRSGVDAGALLGSRDSEGGLLFVSESRQTNSASGCDLTVRTQLSLRIDPEREDDVGDPCVALVGRQVDETSSSAACDAVGVPPQPIVRIVRRRWEPLPDSSTCGQSD